MRKTHKTSFVVLVILTIIFFAGWLTLSFFFGNPPEGYAEIGKLSCTTIADPQIWQNFVKFDSGILELTIFNITGYVVLAAALVLILVSIFAIKKKPLAKTFGILAGVLLIPAAILTLNYVSAGYLFLTDNLIGAKAFEADFKSFGILHLVFLGLGLLFFVFYFAATIVGVKYARNSLWNKIALAAEQEKVDVQADEIPANEFEEYEAEPVPVFIPEPEAEPEVAPVVVAAPAAVEEAPAPVEEEPKEEAPAPVEQTPAPAPAFDPKELAMLIRDIVRDELARNNDKTVPSNDSHTDNHSIVGATFAGPLVVQYFNSPLPGATPSVVATPAPVEQTPAPAPVPVEAKKEEPKPALFTKKEAPVEKAPEVTPAPVVEAPTEEPKAPIVRISFTERMLDADPDMKKNYNTIKNEILAYGVHSRVSNSGDTFRLHRKTFIKLTVAGKSLKLYFALDPADYVDSKIPVIDASEKAAYAEIPLVFKVRSDLSVRRCIQLVADVMERDGLTKGEVLSVDWVKELKFLLKEAEKNKKSLDDED